MELINFCYSFLNENKDFIKFNLENDKINLNTIEDYAKT
jgi:hypothetical protein